MRSAALAVAVVVLLSGCIGGFGGADPATELPENTPPADGVLEIHHIDVGQADSTLLVTPSGETVLIDTGDWRDDGEPVIEYLEAQGVDRIDHLVTTHGHADHVGGHPAVIEHFETEGEGVGAIYDSGVVHTTATYDRYLAAVERYNVTLFEVVEGDEIPLEGVEATVRNPSEGERLKDGPDHNSVAITLEYGDFTYIVTGDAGPAAERRMSDRWGDELAADVYQAGHHGSWTSSTPPFLDAVEPDVAVISSAYDSPYGHPHDEVLETFSFRGIETYWTGVHGDVVVRTDGERVTVETEAEATTDPAALLELKPEEDSAEERSVVRELIDVLAAHIEDR